jgi:hypothetical protein
MNIDDFMESVSIGHQEFALFASMDGPWFGSVLHLKDISTLEPLADIALQAWIGQRDGDLHQYAALLTECLGQDTSEESARVLTTSVIYKIAALILASQYITFDQVRGVGLRLWVDTATSGRLEPSIWLRAPDDDDDDDDDGAL